MKLRAKYAYQGVLHQITLIKGLPCKFLREQ